MKLQKIIFYSLLAIFPLGQLVRINLSFLPGISLQPIDFAVFLFVTIWLLEKISSKDKFIQPKFFREMLIFASLATLSFIIKAFSIDFKNLLSSFFYLFRLWNIFLFYWAFTDFLKETKIPILKILYFEGTAVAALSVFQYIFLPDTRFLFNLGWDMHYFRAIGPFLDPSFNALILLLAFLIILVGFTPRAHPEGELRELRGLPAGRQGWRVVGGVLIFLAIALSFSRIVYLSLILSIFLVLYIKKKKKLLFLIMAGFLIILYLLPKPTGEGVDLFRISSFVSRSDNYNQAISIIKNNYWFGVGYNNYRLVQKEYGFLKDRDWLTTHAGAGADNSFLFVLATTGIFGLGAFVYLWFKAVKEAVLSISKNKYSLLLLSSSLSILITAFVINSLFYPWVILWFLIILSKFTVESLG